MLIPDRVREQMQVMGWIFPYPDEKKIHPMEKAIGFKFKDLIPVIIESLAKDMLEHQESTEMYLQWLGEFHLYVTGQVDEPPAIEMERK